MGTKDIKSVLYKLLDERNKYKNDFLVEDFPGFISHKIGLDTEENCCILIKSDQSKPISKIDLDTYKHFQVFFNKSCELISYNGVVEKSKFTVIQFYEEDIELQLYFLDVCGTILYKLGNKPSLKDTYNSLRYLLELFNKTISPSKSTIQGLWGELLLIDISSDPEYMINSWHVNPTDTFDFNDGTSKLEVKSTSKQERVHNFSINQLINHGSTELLIASVLVIESGLGKSVIDLIYSIKLRVNNPEVFLKLSEIVFNTLGNLTNSISIVKYDFQYSKDCLAFYDSQDIPIIPIKTIPNNVTSVRFDVNLKNINEISSVTSKLFSTLTI